MGSKCCIPKKNPKNTISGSTLYPCTRLVNHSFQEGLLLSPGKFPLAQLTLNLGENKITARVRDSEGNISKTTEMIVVVYNEPPAAPTGLATAVQDYQVQLTWNPNAESDVSGYNLYRKGERINTPVAISPEAATASASFSDYSGPAAAFDSNPDTYWISSITPDGNGGWQPVWWEIDLPSAELISHVEIHWVSYTDDQGYETLYAGKDYEIQAWSGYAWIPLKKVEGNNTKDNTFDFKPPYRTDKIRVYIQDTTDPSDAKQVVISEIGIVKDNLVIPASYADSSLEDGYYDYTVTAVDYYGFESLPSDEIRTAVGDVTPPSIPVNLIASASVPNIALSWDPPVADAAGYNIYRYTPAGWIKINSFPIIPPTYVDANLPNGVYRYTVTAVDNAGNESLPSNEAMANVYLNPPEAPSNLRVAAVPGGRALNATWEFGGSAAAGFNLYRSLTTGGPYQKVCTLPISGLSYLDGGLNNGVAYYYVVVAVDSCGNEGNYSNEAKGMPADRTAPARPYLSYPTRSGVPVVLNRDKTDISGMAEPATTVELFRDGALVGQTVAGESDILQDFSLNLSAVERVNEPSISPDGKNLAYTVSNTSTGDQSVWFKNLLTGITVQVSRGSSSPVWSPDGTRLAYCKYVGYYTRIYVYDTSAGTSTSLTDVSESPYASENGASWSGDGRKIAFASDRGWSWDVWIKDLASGSMTQITHMGNLYSPPKLSPDGQWLGYFVDQTLYVLDLATGNSTEVDTQTDGQSLVWSPDSQGLTFISKRNGNADIIVLDVHSGVQRQITDSGGDEFYSAWSPDGTSMVYIKAENDGSQALWLASTQAQGQKRVIQQNLQYPRFLSWAKSGEIAFDDRSGWHLLYLQGYFNFPDMAINSGENIFQARAMDAAGNVSPFSEEISVGFDSTVVPDLEITAEDLFIYPATPIAGEEVKITAIVKNKGPMEMADVKVDIYLWDYSGNLQLLKEANIPHMDPQAEEPIGLSFDTQGKKGTHRILVTVDPQNKIRELSKANNLAERELFIAEKEGIFMDTSLDSNQYHNDQDVNIQINLRNSGGEKDVVMEVWVEDSDGAAVTLVETVRTHLPYASQQNYALVWNTGSTYAGAYRVHPVLKGGNEVQAENVVPFTLLPDIHIVASVVTDKTKYQANENVVVNLAVKNAGQNYIVPEMKARVRIVDAADQDLLDEEKEVRNLLIGGTTRFRSTWNTGRHLPGDYRVIMEVSNNGSLVLGKSASFQIDSSIMLTGKLTLAPSFVLRGGTVQVDYAIQNNGNQDIRDLPLKVLVVEPETQVIMDTQEKSIDVTVNDLQSGQYILPTGGYGFKTYVLNLVYLYQGNQKNLASTSFTVKDGTPPEVSVISPAPNACFNSTLQIATLASDSGSGLDRVEYQQDGGSWKLLPVSDPSQGRYSTSWTPILSDEGRHTINFRATDRSGNISLPIAATFMIDLTPPAPPQITSPPDQSVVASGVVEIRGIAEKGSSVELSSGSTFTTGANTDTGEFLFAGIQLNPGENIFRFTAIDRAGNRSLPRDYQLIYTAVTSQVVTDKLKYNPKEKVTSKSTIRNASTQSPVQNLVARISIVSSGGQALFLEEKQVPTVPPNSPAEVTTEWNTSTNPKGQYTVKLEVAQSGIILSSSTTRFEILGTNQTGEGLGGKITATPTPVDQGKDETFLLTISNEGNEDVASLHVKVLIVNPDTQEIQNAVEKTINLPMNVTKTDNLSCSTSNLSPRTYTAIFQVLSDGMTQPKTLSSTPFEVKNSVEVTKTVPQETHLLVWVNDSCEEHRKGQRKGHHCVFDKCTQVDLLERILKEAVTNYHILYSGKDFQTELRNPFYTDFLILGDHRRWEDPYGDELREQVFSGKGLISSFYLKPGRDHEEGQDALFGLRYEGDLSGDEHRVHFVQSPISEDGILEVAGEAARIEAEKPNQVVAWIDGTVCGHSKKVRRYPGIVTNHYGRGKTIFYAFDLGLNLNEKNYNLLSTLIKNSIQYIHTPPEETTFSPYQIIPVEVKLKSQGGALDLRITETYPKQWKLYDSISEKWVTDRPWVVNMHLDPRGTRTILYEALTPDQAGTYTLKTDVEIKDAGTYRLSQSLSTDILVDKDTRTVAGDIMAALKALSVTGKKDKESLKMAIRQMEDVQRREVVRKRDIEKNVDDILEGINSLLSITSNDVAEIRLMMDRLLKMWEGKWYYNK